MKPTVSLTTASLLLGQPDQPYGRIESGEHTRVDRDLSTGQAIKQSGFTGIRVADHGESR